VQPAPNHVYQGDCLSWLERIEPESVDLVFADPPFNIGYAYDVYKDRRSPQEYLAWTRRWMSGVWRVLRPSGTFWLAIGDEMAAELKVLAQRLFAGPDGGGGTEVRPAAGHHAEHGRRRRGRKPANAVSVPPEGFTCRSWIVWYYTFGVNCTRAFSRSHTHLFYFVKDPQRFTFNAEDPAIRVPSARQLVYADGRANPRGRLPDNTWILRPQDVPGGFAPRHDTWYFPRVAGTFKEREGFHGCQMPEQLLGRIVQCCSKMGDVVLDPFAGSGTTLAVAKKLRRQWIGLELSPDYVERIGLRLENTRPGDLLDGAADPLTSAPATPAAASRRTSRRRAPLAASQKPSREKQETPQQLLPFLQAPRRSRRGARARTRKK
jgi:site-specific DNA-methyltransferase (adenine-specific)